MRRRSRAGGKSPNAQSRKTATRKRRIAPKAGRPSSSAAEQKELAEARRLERSLRESEERYALVSQAVAEGIYDWNIELNSLFVSSRLMEIFSFEGPGLSSQDWYHRVHPEDKESYRTALRDCFKQRALKLECQYRIRAADGNYRWVEDHGLPVRNEVGRAIRLVGAVSDISRRHQTEQTLRDRDQELDAVLDTIDYGILFMGPDLRAKIINRAFRQMWGISDEFIQTKRPTMGDLINYNRHNNLYDVPAVEFDDYVARRVEAVRSGTRSISEMRLLDGRIIQHRVMALPDGGRMLTYFDITDLKRSEEQLRRRTADLTESLEQQTATSEVLQVISSSPGDRQSVFAAMLENAVRTCDAKFGNIYRWKDDTLHLVAAHNTPHALAEARRRWPLARRTSPIVDRLVTTKSADHVADARTLPGDQPPSG